MIVSVINKINDANSLGEHNQLLESINKLFTVPNSKAVLVAMIAHPETTAHDLSQILSNSKEHIDPQGFDNLYSASFDLFEYCQTEDNAREIYSYIIGLARTNKINFDKPIYQEITRFFRDSRYSQLTRDKARLA